MNAQQRISAKAKSNLLLFFLLCLSSLMGCQKDGEIVPLPPSPEIQFRTGEQPSVMHNMLSFESFPQLRAFTQSLEEQEADVELVRNAYTALGVDVDAETLPNLTDHPVCLTTEMAIGGYTSARKSEETVINAALNSGDDNINSIVFKPYWKTVVNADQSVFVGRRIYKYYENGGMAIVLNNDWALYESIKTQQFEALRQSYNLIVTSDEPEGLCSYFTLGLDEHISTETRLFQPLFMATNAPGGKLEITNHSLVEGTGTTYTWYYSDNTSSVGKNPNRTVSPTEALSVIVSNGADMTETLTGLEAILACTTDNFTISYLSNNQVRFELPGFDPNNPANLYTIRWEFSNGSYSTSNPVVKTFGANGTATCKLFHKNSGEVACQFTKPFSIKCGDKKTVNRSRQFNVCNQRWKLDGSIWVEKGQVGCKVKYLKRVLFMWVPANNQAACADLNGTYIREGSNPQSCPTIVASGSRCLGGGTFPTNVAFTIPEVSNVFMDPGMLTAGLGIKVCGTWIGWGYGGLPRLVLI
ncbi:MAG: hypothetical protein ACKV1O_13800 [Saprospiraceae bacterium]